MCSMLRKADSFDYTVVDCINSFGQVNTTMATMSAMATISKYHNTNPTVIIEFIRMFIMKFMFVIGLQEFQIKIQNSIKLKIRVIRFIM